ncbi:MAG: Uma2 family endonuclease [Gemmataceae bacterium]
MLLNPSVIVEDLSPSTERYDRGLNFRQYQLIDSLKEIVLVSQDEPVIERFVRRTADTWEFTNTAGLENEFAFGTVPVRTQMAAIYAGITFPEASGP